MKVSDKQEAILILCSLTGFPLGEIRQCLTSSHYREVPKFEKGKIRILHVPDETLMLLQSSILERILYQLPVSPAAHCAVLHRSAKTNVKVHLKGKSWFKLDFKDAFPSVSREMIIEHLTPLLIQRYTNFPTETVKDLASLLSFLGSYKNALPQGAPTSPVMMNLVCYELDLELIKIAEIFGLKYTRYSDDLCFSTPESKIPKRVRVTIIETVKGYGFKINKEKTRYKTGKATVAKVTGITLIPGGTDGSEVKTSLPRKTIERYRNIIHRATFDLEIKIEEVFGILGWVGMGTDGKIPARLKKTVREFLEHRCPQRLPRYLHLLK